MLASTAAILHDRVDNKPPVSDEEKRDYPSVSTRGKLSFHWYRIPGFESAIQALHANSTTILDS